jgi:hypothetical protein
MGLLTKTIGTIAGAKLLKRMQEAQRDPAASGQYIPAGQADRARPYPTRMNDTLLARCGRFCQENPKLVTTVGSAVLAIALAKLAQRRRV